MPLSASEIDRDSPEWREVDTLLGGYLHQDFEVVHRDAWPAVTEYAAESTRAERTDCAHCIRRLLELDEAALKAIVDHFGCAYYPPGDGYSSYRVWLTAVADYLDDPEAHPGPPGRDAPMPG